MGDPFKIIYRCTMISPVNIGKCSSRFDVHSLVDTHHQHQGICWGQSSEAGEALTPWNWWITRPWSTGSVPDGSLRLWQLETFRGGVQLHDFIEILVRLEAGQISPGAMEFMECPKKAKILTETDRNSETSMKWHLIVTHLRISSP